MENPLNGLVISLLYFASAAGYAQVEPPQPPTPLPVDVVNTLLPVEVALVNVSQIESEEFTVSEPGYTFGFNKSVVLRDISFVPVPPVNRRLSGQTTFPILYLQF